MSSTLRGCEDDEEGKLLLLGLAIGATYVLVRDHAVSAAAIEETYCSLAGGSCWRHATIQGRADCELHHERAGPARCEPPELTLKENMEDDDEGSGVRSGPCKEVDAM
ncbi:hypothetical protein OH76DRAFT_1417845 [Lentinus brumalis]|uniref:Uncharacterized protein n=1 Tax=Lentinus brumalis TaxID=2498619 RepID=A0A371DDB0_9APHY|nr:hypothetical protein OH76DRAFT_1417845 [Polyporus brumalis]